MVNLKINGTDISVKEGTTILEAAKQLNITIPTLCHLDLGELKFVNKMASCRLCLVEDARWGNLMTSCATPVKEGMDIRTDTPHVIQERRMIMELLLSNHPKSCLTCPKNGSCELQELAQSIGVRRIRHEVKKVSHPVDDSSRSLVRNPAKCILCQRCLTMCNEVQTVGALGEIGRGFNTYISTLYGMPMVNSNCTFCGQCVAVCPTAALTEIDDSDKVWDAINDDSKFVVVQTAPAVRVALGEMFGMEPGTDVTGRMVTALRKMGFDRIYDTNFAADVTIMEEAAEMLKRIREKKDLPILTSCCPSWVNFIEQQFSDMLNIPSTAKSPHEIFGVLAKTYLADQLKLDPENIVVVSVMPCVAKKYEAARPELQNQGYPDVDYVISTRELGHMLQNMGLDFPNLPDSDFDELMGQASGAGDIFGSSGGVIEASLRTAYEWYTGKTLENVEFTALRGLDGIKEAVVDFDGTPIKVACASGLGNARKLLEKIRSGQASYTAIEIMACPGGCIAGGGQPYHHGDVEIVEKRMAAIYQHERGKKVRQSHKNPYIKKLYEEYLGEPGGKRAEELLHTSYTPHAEWPEL